MVLHGQSTQTASATATAVPAAATTSSVMVNQVQPVVVFQRKVGGGCDCSVPPSASQAVKATRWSSIAIIIIHAIALLAFGFYIWAQWFASLFGIIMGSVLLCNFNKCCYTTAAVLFSIAVLFDLIAAFIWLIIGGGPLAIPAFLGAVASFIGAIAACMATCGWDDSGVNFAQSGPVQASYPATVPSTHAAIVQPNYTYPAASQGAPPAYHNGV